MAGVGNRFLMFKDVNTCYDAWELGSMYENLSVELEQKAEISIVDGPNNAVLQVKKQLLGFQIQQQTETKRWLQRLVCKSFNQM